MTINPEDNLPKITEEPPLTPTNEGTLQFLGPDTVKYISPPRNEIPKSRIRPEFIRPAPPPPTQHYQAPPPSYQSSVYAQNLCPPQPPCIPVPVPMMSPQYMQHPQMMYTVPQPMMAPAMMTSPIMMAPQAPVQISPPQANQNPSPSITLNINQSPQSVGGITAIGNLGGGGGGGVLICPKCRKGIITRKQHRFRKRLFILLSIFCCPLTCGLPLLCLCCNYVDACACCGKQYGHRGRKTHKNKVNAVKL